MFNAGQQVGGAIGLATIGTVAWTAFNNHVRTAIHSTATHLAAPPRVGSPIYDHALSAGVTRGLTIGAIGATLAFVIALATIRVPREQLPDRLVVI